MIIYSQHCWMSKKETIEFRQNIPRTTSDISQQLIPFQESTIPYQTKNTLTKQQSLSSPKHSQMIAEQTLSIHLPETIQLNFNISIALINLLRDPQMDGQKVKTTDKCIGKIYYILKEIEQKYNVDIHYRMHVLYIHAIMSEIKRFNHNKEIFRGKDWNKIIEKKQHSNAINVHALMCRIQKLIYFKEDISKYDINSQFAELNISVTNQKQVNAFSEKTLYISKDYVDYAIREKGLLDPHFGSFLLKSFKHIPTLRYFCPCELEQLRSIQLSYAEQFSRIMLENQSSTQEDYENWYHSQISSLINGTFSIEDIKNKVINRHQNKWIQKFLIGLLGWDEKRAAQATVLLNAYYDEVDWQIFAPFNPIIGQVGEKCHVNYLIDSKQNRYCLNFCLKAPSMDDAYKGSVFSWHSPTMNEYSSDGDRYLWINIKFHDFISSGFYDWKLFEMGSDGRNHSVHKIVSQKKKSTSKFDKKVQDVKPVQGRFIVHPEKTRHMQIHQVYMDSLSINQNSNKVPHFQDAIKDIEKYSHYGIDCVYLMGVFQRDSGKFQGGFRRPQASPIALVSRNRPCQMLGGENGFCQLTKKSNQIGMKIIIDCTARVSSSRYDSVYQPFMLYHLDQAGKKLPFYGAEGRSINYEDTMVLNYRKLDAWNLLIDEVMGVIDRYGISGIYLDNGSSWPNIFQTNSEQMLRVDHKKQRFYTNEQIFQGKIVDKRKIGGYWNSKKTEYPNPMFIKIIKTIWQKYNKFNMICQSFQMIDKDQKNISAIISGAIPRTFKMPRAISQIIGLNLHESGKISQITPKNIITFKKWYEQIQKLLPRNSIIIQSTSSHSWPYPAFLFKRATWAFIDLIFFLPEIPMTFIGEHDGRAYRSKATSIFFENQNQEEKKGGQQNKFTKTNSSFFNTDIMMDASQKISSSVNATIRDPAQIKYLEENFRRQVGPEYGFDLAQIHKHYTHRRKLRNQISLLTTGKMISVSAQHKYGVHKNVLSFAKWNSQQILLISINFNDTEIEMHYNLNNLKYLFTKAYQSNLIVKLKEIFGNTGIEESYYTVSQLIVSRLEVSLKAYQSIIWQLTILKDADPKIAYQSSIKRMAKKISSVPPQWIYSSVFTNQLSYMLDSCKSSKIFVEHLSWLYEEFIAPENLNFSLVISKTYDFWLNNTKLSKLFGIFKLIEKFPEVNSTLKKSIKSLIEENILGPIAFVTPEIGQWSTVGGLGVMVDQLSKQLAKLGEQVYIVAPYYEYNKKGENDYLPKYGFKYEKTIKVWSAHISQQFGVHVGKYKGVNFIWLHNPQLFSRPYEGEGALYVTKQLVFFALSTLQAFCQLKMLPSIVVTNDWMCGFVSAYVKVNRYAQVFKGTKFMHICHNLDPLYEGRLYPKPEQGDLNWLVQLPKQWYLQYRLNKTVINPSKCALQSCDNWGTVSNSYKFDLLKDSPLASILWKHPNPFAFPNGVRKQERISLLQSKTPGTHQQSKKLLQQKYFPNTTPNLDIPLLAFIGRVTKQKGVHLILDSIQAILHQYSYKVQFIVGGPADRKQQYGKYCSDRMQYLNQKYPHCFWSDYRSFFYDGPLCNIGCDYAMMPSLFEPGGIVQHEFFCGSTPVIAFRTGGLKDTVFEYDKNTNKGNGFNFMSYQLEDFKNCLRRGIQLFKTDKLGYQQLRVNAFDSVIEEEDVAKGWNTQFYRLQNKIYIDWLSVEKYIESIKQNEKSDKIIEIKSIGEHGQFWSQQWDIKREFRAVLQSCQKLKSKQVNFVYESQKIPRPKDVSVAGSWDNWKINKKMIYQPNKKNWKISLLLQPGTYYYKYVVDNQWLLNKKQQIETDINNIENHVITIQ